MIPKCGARLGCGSGWCRVDGTVCTTDMTSPFKPHVFRLRPWPSCDHTFRSVCAAARSCVNFAAVTQQGQLQWTVGGAVLYPHIVWDYVVPTRHGFCAVSADGHQLLIKASSAPWMAANFPDRMVRCDNGRIVKVAPGRKYLMFVTDTARLYKVGELYASREEVLSGPCPQQCQAWFVRDNVIDVVHANGFWALTRRGSALWLDHLPHAHFLDAKGLLAVMPAVDRDGVCVLRATPSSSPQC
eukprot:TRINITY_DN9475_c0_g1_i1.p1 TRINITY_DN9475_c0_g1~~TRINITY_DN9475_c0_g1_i1.p1  ORF type:complete len:242 (-),score=35.45 TRINITY_DN9475_c0_g1_i1:33-758(-)